MTLTAFSKPTSLQENHAKPTFFVGENEGITSKARPEFLVPLPEVVSLSEGETLTLETNYIPKDDPDLEVKWYHNGMPLKSGSRIVATAELGTVKLTVGQTTALDQGVYTCKAVNQAGEAVVFTKVDAKGDQSELDTSTQHPKGQQGFKASCIYFT